MRKVFSSKESSIKRTADKNSINYFVTVANKSMLLNRFILFLITIMFISGYNFKTIAAEVNIMETEVAQMFNPNDVLMLPQAQYSYIIETQDECCVKITYYCVRWAKNDTFIIDVAGGTVTGGNENTVINKEGKENGISMIICASDPPTDIVINMSIKLPFGYLWPLNPITIPASYFADCIPEPPEPPVEPSCSDNICDYDSTYIDSLKEAGIKPPTLCEPEIGWEDKTKTLTIPGFPDCKFTYTYRSRECCGEIQVEGAKISFYYNPYSTKPTDCNALYNHITRPSRPEDGVPENTRVPVIELVDAVFKESFAALAESILMDGINDILKKIEKGEITEEVGEAILKSFDCNNPDQGGVTVSYYKSNCESYFTGIYNVGNKFESRIETFKCNQASCCREARHMCYDFDKKEPVAQVDYTETGDPCPPRPKPTVPQELKDKAIYWYQSDCNANCGPSK